MGRRRTLSQWRLELILAAVAGVLGLFFLRGAISDGDSPPLWAELAAGSAALAGLVLFRRDRPVALTLVLISCGLFFAMPMGATPVALFAVGLHRPARVAVMLEALHAVLVAGVYLLVLGFTAEYREAVSFLVLLHVSLVAVAMLIRSQRLLVRSWADRARQAEQGEALRIEQARLAERERIAREMHDVLAHRISLLAVHAGALEVHRAAPPAERATAGVIRQCAHDALEDLRQVIGMLREPADDRPQPTLADVPALIEQSRAAGATVALELTSGRLDRGAGLDPSGLDGGELDRGQLGRGDGGFDGVAVPAGVGRHAYRIVQEALTNARKHAPGAPVRVAVTGGPETGLVVEVGNPLAVTAAAIPGAGAGLVGLGERVHLAGGRLEHGRTASGDFRLRAWLPWQP